MKICLNCQDQYTSHLLTCPACLFEPTTVQGFPAFAPEFAKQNDGFNGEFFSQLVTLEKNNFWFKARNQLIIWALKKYFPDAKHFLEIGCGTGFVLSGIHAALPNLKLSASEIYSNGLQFAADRVKHANLFQMDARKIPYENEFTVIGAFDVLEHIKEDESVLAEMYRACQPGGGVIITVPQHQFLWSQQDEYACHVRRYAASDLKNKVTKAGFTLVKSTSFVTLLLPLLMASRLSKRKPKQENYDALSEFKISPFINTVLEKCLDIERAFIKWGLPLPVGGSLLLIARKN